MKLLSTSITFLIMFFLPFISSVSCDLIHDSCGKASKSSPNFSSDYCVSSLEANPNSKNVSSLEDLVVISLELTISKAAKISSHIEQLLKDNNEKTKNGLEDCSSLYSDANLALQHALYDLAKLKDYQGANIKVSSTMDTSTTCEDGFKEAKESSPLTKENDAFFKSTAVVLAFINMLH